MYRLPIILVLCAAFATAQTRSAVGCADLRSLTNHEISIASAQLIPASGGVPEHCRIAGQVLPQVAFEVNLPARWNGRLYMFGNGGYAGEAFDSPGRVNAHNTALKRGFASASTDTGHSAITEPGAVFALDHQKLLDWAFRSLHVTAEAAKLLARTYYGSAPTRSFFDGCSTGGRQGLILAQRFPDDFDGIAVGAPVLDWTGTMIAFTGNAQALKANPFPPSKLPLLAERIYAQCDAKDGLKDGLIDDPRNCHFDPARDLPRCENGAGQADCFTSGEISSLQAIYSDKVSQGKRVHPGWPVGGENGRNGWDPWIVHEGGPTLDASFAEGFFRYIVFPKPDPQYDLSQFNLGTDLPKLQTAASIINATDPDLTRFEKHGGKILMYFGWADPALNPLMGIEYYERVKDRMGAGTTGFFRLFMVPGMFHCGGGVGPDAFDKLGALAEWVDHGTAPDRIVASRSVNGAVVRTRPLCAYPEVARYKGSGSIDDAANFTCGKP